MKVSPHSSQIEQQTCLARINDALRTRYWSWTFVSPIGAPKTLRQLLLQELPHIPLDSWSERFDFGGLYINGHEALSDQPLPFPCRVEYYEPKFEIQCANTIFPPFKDEFIVYEDGDIAVVFKPAKLPSMPAKEQRHFSLKNEVEKKLGRHIHMPSRLDVSAQGILVLSTSQRTHAPLQRAFESRHVRKTYLCASSNKPLWEERAVTSPIGRDPLHPVLRKTDGIDPQSAETHLSCLGSAQSENSEVSIARARPITGRTHQIRVHAASEGFPLFGDSFYEGSPASQLHLVSCAIELTHPITEKAFRAEIPPSLRPAWISGFEKYF